MTTLDDVGRTFDSEAALVCDAEGPSGIADHGRSNLQVSDKTTRVLMEAATWVGPNIMRTSKALGLRTEASARFEKQLHPDLAMAAQRLRQADGRACGARFVPGTVDAYPSPAEPRNVEPGPSARAPARRAHPAGAGDRDPRPAWLRPAPATAAWR